MMQIMRDKTQGIIAVIIAVVIALTFILWGAQNYLTTDNKERVVAKVNGKKITQMQWQIAYEQLKREYGFSLDQKTQVQLLKKSVLQQLIKKEIISQAVTKMGFDIGKEQLWAVVSGLSIFQINGRFSFEYFQAIAERVFHSKQAFLDELKIYLLQHQLEEGIVDSEFDLPNEISAVKQLFKQRRDFVYFVISPERFSKTTQVDSADIKKYYEQHQNEFVIPEKISIQYLELSSDGMRDKINPSSEQLEQYYKSHINSFSTPKKWYVTKILLPLPQAADAKALDSAKNKLMQIKAGDDLTKVVGASETKVWLTLNEARSALIPQLDKLTVGQISKPFRTKNGYSLVKVLAVLDGVPEPYKAVAAKVKQGYEREQLAKIFSEANDKLVDLTYTNSDSLEPAAQELGLKIYTTNLVTEAGDKSDKSGILSNNKIIKTAFSEAVLKHGYNSNPVDIGHGKLVVLRIKEHIPEVVQPLDMVRIVIAEKLKIKAMQKKSYDLSQELLAQVRKGKSISELAKQYGLNLVTITDSRRDQDGKDIKLVEAAFSLTKPNTNEFSATVVDLKDGYAVLQLTKVYDSKSHHETAKEIEILKSLPKRLGKFDYQLLIDGLMNKAKIKINKEVEDR